MWEVRSGDSRLQSITQTAATGKGHSSFSVSRRVCFFFFLLFISFFFQKYFLLPESRTSLIRTNGDCGCEKQKMDPPFSLRAKLRFFFPHRLEKCAIDYRLAGSACVVLVLSFETWN